MKHDKKQDQKQQGSEKPHASSGSDERSGGTQAPNPGNRGEQRHQKESQASQMSSANVEESPHMDRGDSRGGSGQSKGGSAHASEAPKRGAVDTQYGTDSSMKSGHASGKPSASKQDAEHADTPNPGSSEKSSGADRDTMSGSRPGNRS